MQRLHSNVINVLARLIAERGAPTFIRSDNGPEFVAKAIPTWMSTSGIEAAYIPPVVRGKTASTKVSTDASEINA